MPDTRSNNLTMKDKDDILQAIHDSKMELSKKMDDMKDELVATNKRVDALEATKAGERLDNVEEAIKEFRSATEELKQTNIDTVNRSIMQELKMKERNVIVFGVPQYKKWETRQESFDAVYDFLFPIVLKIPPSEVIHIEDAHRLMGAAYNNDDEDINRDFPNNNEEVGAWTPPLRKPYPLIFRISNVLKHKLVMKAFFDKLSYYNRSNSETRIYVAERHLPKRMMDNRKELLPQFLEAKRNREKPRWFVDHDNAIYCFKTKVNKRIVKPKTLL